MASSRPTVANKSHDISNELYIRIFKISKGIFVNKAVK